MEVHARLEVNPERQRTPAVNSNEGRACRISELNSTRSIGLGRWPEPPTALQELREGKLKSSSQKPQVDLGVTEADIDAVLNSVRHSLSKPTFSNTNSTIASMSHVELPNFADHRPVSNFEDHRTIEVSHSAEDALGSSQANESNYGAINEKPSVFLPSRPLPDSRVTRAAIWMGVMFTFLFVASYSMSERTHARRLAPGAKAQQLAAGHILHAPIKPGSHAHNLAALHRAAAEAAKRARPAGPDSHPAPARPAAAAAAHKASREGGGGSDSAIIRAEEKRMAKAVDSSNDRFVRALLKGGV